MIENFEYNVYLIEKSFKIESRLFFSGVFSMSDNKETFDFTTETLGVCKIKSPIELSTVVGDCRANYVTDDSFVRNTVNVFDTTKPDVLDSSNLMQKAGPREYIFFEPKDVCAGICTCGGLCP